MDVTVNNFKEILDEFNEVIEKAAFFSIDSEFTGLYNERTLPFATPSEFYKKLHGGTDDYIIIQLGITAFYISEDKSDTFTYKSYNFYVFPQNRDQIFKCSGSSLSFLAEQKFDFNKLFREGVSCCTQDVALQLRAKYDERQKAREEALEVRDEKPANFDEVPVPHEELDKLNEVKCKIQKFLEAGEKDSENNVVFGNCNAFQRKLIYQVIQKEFYDEVTATSQTVNNQKVIVIERKWSTERQQQGVDQQNEEDEAEYRRLVGLSALLLKISKSKKPIVGHNMFMDLFYLIRQFFEPLAETLKSFKKQAHKIFPNIFDTKHICNQKFRNEISNSTLKNLYDAVLQAPFKLPQIEPASPEYGYTETNSKQHEAGYDSYMTGVCFLGLARKLNVNNADISSKSAQLRPLLNKIFVMRLTDIYYIDLTGTEPKPNREHVFHVTFPETWAQTDIINHFRKFGPVFIRWIDNTSAFVSLMNRENAPILLKSITATKGVKISTFAMYLRATGADKEDETEDGEAEGSAAKKRPSCVDTTHNQRATKLPKLTETKIEAKQTEFVKQEEWPEAKF
ncbi:poly(A)-specific ribonuclease PARN-like isoform X2 [Sitodiplosis mosellana]|uniref:poly(A)-specific ribonuclease PARN-like isoform X2 n=1 Tax=Sitodiplosis mosellana TaxID=263140 RepID=UPI00244462A6|nr:poly(A)-specific ribonuclease PARN-like isoform X2 [Sitodiplosis mosellana]